MARARLERAARAAPRAVADRSARDRLAPALAALALAALVLVAYAPATDLPFTALDDPQYVAANPIVAQGLTGEGLRYAFATTDMGNWHPLTWLSHMAVAQLAGLDPGPHHVANLVLHALASMLAFAWLLAAGLRPGASFAAAALFALHPLRVESVAWVAERKDVLAAVFGLAAALAWLRYVRSRRRAWSAAATALFAASLMSKPMLVTLPFALLLVDLWPLRRWQVGPGALARLRPLVLEKAPLFALAAVFAAVAVFAQREAGALRTVKDVALSSRLANAALAVAAYLRQTFWPRDLAIFYPFPRSFDALQVAGAALLILISSALALHQVRRRPWLLTGWAWFLLLLLPVAGLVQVGEQARADRYTYLPHLGLFAALAWGVAEELRGLSARRAVLAGLACAAILACVLLTRRQLEVWRDDATLFTHALEATENNWLAHDYLGSALLARGLASQAAEHHRAAALLRPDFAPAHSNLGRALEALGQYEAALASHRRAVELAPEFGAARTNLGALLARMGRRDEARSELTRVLELDPRDALAHFDLALVLALQGEVPGALAHFREAIRLRAELGRGPEALEFAWHLATEGDPGLRDAALAERLALQAVEAEPSARAFEVLAAAQAELGRLDVARASVGEALRRAQASGDAQAARRLALELERLRAGLPLRGAGGR